MFILHSRIPGFPPGILYVLVNGRNTEIHVLGDKVYETRVSISELAGQLTEGFIRIHRGCLVAVRVIHDITDRVYLNNGEALALTDYSPEIDTYLKVICFPTFPGHCGFILPDTPLTNKQAWCSL